MAVTVYIGLTDGRFAMAKFSTSRVWNKAPVGSTIIFEDILISHQNTVWHRPRETRTQKSTWSVQPFWYNTGHDRQTHTHRHITTANTCAIHSIVTWVKMIPDTPCVMRNVEARLADCRVFLPWMLRNQFHKPTDQGAATQRADHPTCWRACLQVVRACRSAAGTDDRVRPSRGRTTTPDSWAVSVCRRPHRAPRADATSVRLSWDTGNCSPNWLPPPLNTVHKPANQQSAKRANVTDN